MQSRRTEFDYLKTIALVLLLFVHSSLLFAFPEVVYPVEWFILSVFFFVGGFLAYSSFQKRSQRLTSFFKSKVVSLYIPFIIVLVLYFLFQTQLGIMNRLINATPSGLLYYGSLLNIFEVCNTDAYLYHLWFVPYLLIFMTISVCLEKYVKNVKAQILLVSFLWVLGILGWVVDAPWKLGWAFSQYLLVFMTGFWLNKCDACDKIVKSNALVIVFMFTIIFFSVNLSYFFVSNNLIEILKYQLYVNTRTFALSLSVIFLAAHFIRTRVRGNRFITLIAKQSLLIYLVEPLVSTFASNYIFNKPTLYAVTGLEFYSFQLVRFALLFILLPLAVKQVGKRMKRVRDCKSETA